MSIDRGFNIIAALVALFAYVVTGNPVMLLAAVAVLGFVVLGSPIVRALERRTDISFDLKPSCEVGRELPLEITVARPMIFRGSIELVLECRNVLLGSVEQVPVTLSPATGDVERFELALDTSRVGRVTVELLSARVVDVFGFSSVPAYGARLSVSYVVYPAILDIEAVTHRGYRAATSGLVFDHHKKGQDLSEVFELREYRDGDPMRRVHWKLSARFGEPMVREPSHPADFDLAIGLSIAGRDTGADGNGVVANTAASVFASVSRALLKRSVGHCAVYRNGSVLEVDPVESALGFDDMLDGMLGTTLPAGVEREVHPFASVQRRYGITKLVLVTDTVQEDLFGELNVLCDLTVIFVGGEEGFSVDDSDGYTLIRLSGEAAVSRVKSLEL